MDTTIDSMKKRIRQASDTRGLIEALEECFDAAIDPEPLNRRMQPQEKKEEGELEKAAKKGPRETAADKKAAGETK